MNDKRPSEVETEIRKILSPTIGKIIAENPVANWPIADKVVADIVELFTTERRRADGLANDLAKEVEESKKWFAKSQSRKDEIKVLETRLQEAEAKIASMAGEDHADRCAQSKRLKILLKEAEKEVARLKKVCLGNHIPDVAQANYWESKCMELEAKLAERDNELKTAWLTAEAEADHADELQASLDKHKAVVEALGTDQPYSIFSVLDQLQKAGNHLLHDHSCDIHGHENIQIAIDRIPEIKQKLSEALASLEGDKGNGGME